MSAQFNWQAGDDDGHWETIAETTERPRRRIHWRIWVSLFATIAIAIVCAYVIVRLRYDRASKQIAFQVQSVTDLEARAWAQGDQDLFLAQQDEASLLFWYANQRQRLQAWRGRALTPPLAVLPAEVVDVNMQGDVAWVQVVEGDPSVRRVRFYRRTDQGWLHTTPDLAFWGDPVEYSYGDQLIVHYHQRDQPYIDPLVQQLGQAFYETCASTGCPDDKFEILFYPASPGSDTQMNLTLPSPWLSGIPVEGDWSELNREAAIAALKDRIRTWTGARNRAQARPLWIGADERWLGLSPVTPEAAYLGSLLAGRGGIFRSRSDTRQRSF